MKHTDFDSLADVRRTFPSADRVGRFTVFNIGGNKARLIVAIHYNRKKIYIRHVLTHAEYDEEPGRSSRMIAELERLSAAWTRMSEVLSVPHTEAEYRRVSAILDIVVDEVGEDDSHPLAALMETLGALVDAYEREHVAEPAGSPVQVLRMLMDEHGLSQADLPEVGSQGGRVGGSSRRAQINVRQVRALSERFGVSPAVFV